jgi:hypothetical protein
MDFETLRAQIASAQAGAEVLAKSLAASPSETVDNKTIAAAAADGAAAGGATGTTDADPNAEGEDKENGDGEVLAKSFALTLDDGSVLEAVDGTEMLKSFAAQLNAEKEGRSADNGEFMKAMGATLGVVGQLTATLQEQGTALANANKQLAELKSQGETLAKSLAAVSNEGRGRRSVDLTVHNKLADGAQPNEKPRPAEILAKAMTALSAKAITGVEASKIESALNAGLMPEQALLDRIFTK